MAEVLVEYTDVVLTSGSRRFVARACGSKGDGGRWQGWLEFEDLDSGEFIRTARETTQPNRTDTVYWATGLTAVYLEGALERALHPLVVKAPRPDPEPAFDGPAEPILVEPPPASSILNPFHVYRKGETLLRRQLGALSVWHLVNIIRAHGLSDLPSTSLNALPPESLIEMIADGVKAGYAGSSETVSEP